MAYISLPHTLTAQIRRMLSRRDAFDDTIISTEFEISVSPELPIKLYALLILVLLDDNDVTEQRGKETCMVLESAGKEH